MDKEKILQAGKIAAEVKAYAKDIIKKDMPLLEIAEKIESKIYDLGGKIAFPTNLSINEIAAHYTPLYNDETKARGLLKIDLGIHIDGYIADTAFSLDLEKDSNSKESEENQKLIEASKKALENAINTIKQGKKTTSEIGEAIQNSIEEMGFSPIVNLSGHSMEKYDLHSGISISNIKDKENVFLDNGLYAIEPFATTGNGKVKEGQNSGIYVLLDDKSIRNPTAREILEYIKKEYQTLPFCSRWLVKKFGSKALFALNLLEKNKNLHHFPQLVEVSGKKVSQTENTILITEEEVIVTTEN